MIKINIQLINEVEILMPGINSELTWINELAVICEMGLKITRELYKYMRDHLFF